MSGLIRVLHVQLNLADGGGPRLIVDLARRMPPHNVEMSLVYLRPPHDMVGPYRAAGMETTFLDHRPGRAPLTVIDIARRIRATGVDLVHTHEMLPKLVGHPAARLAGVPKVTHIHGFWPTASRGGYRGLRRRMHFRLAYNRGVSRAVAVSQAVADQYAPMVLCPLVVLHNGVDVKRFGTRAGEAELAALADRLQLEGRRIVLYVGRLVPLKRTETLAPMMDLVRRQAPDSVLVVCGDGPTHRQLAESLEAHRLGEHFRLLGWVDDVVPLLQLADVLVFPSRVEGLGLAPLEAMAAGTPVVASRLPVTAEYVEDGVTGFLVDPRDPDEFAAAVTAILDDVDMARTMAARGRARVVADFNLGVQVARLAQLYEEVVATRRR